MSEPQAGWRRTLNQLKNFRSIARQVKQIVREVRPDARVYIFGSVLRGDYTASSDIDLLIVCSGIEREEALRLKAQILKAFDYSAPLELHVVTPAEFEGWYRRFIDRLEEVE